MSNYVSGEIDDNKNILSDYLLDKSFSKKVDCLESIFLEKDNLEKHNSIIISPVVFTINGCQWYRDIEVTSGKMVRAKNKNNNHKKRKIDQL